MDAPTNLCILITFKPVASCITIHQHLVHRFKKEILEIACLKVGTKSKQVEDSFRQYVRPKYCGRLNGVTMNITGVRQEMVSSAPRFRVAWMKFMNWYSAAKGNHSVAFLTVDSFPINMHLRCQTLLSKMRPSDDFNQWIVLKKVYYKAYDFFPRNLQFMMKELKLPYQGKVENAYDDVTNAALVTQRMLRENIKFEINNHVKIDLGPWPAVRPDRKPYIPPGTLPPGS
nr:PREDICTED: 3'-5' exoribonuclease 1-like isoform X1 [Bemisia tabaci]